MCKFLETHGLPKPTQGGKKEIRTDQEQIQNCFIIQILPKAQDQVTSLVDATKHLKNELQSFSNSFKKERTLLPHFLRTALLWYQRKTDITRRERARGQRPVWAHVDILSGMLASSSAHWEGYAAVSSWIKTRNFLVVQYSLATVKHQAGRRPCQLDAEWARGCA